MGSIHVRLLRVRLLIILGIAACCWLVPLTASAAPARQTAAPPPNDNFADAEVIASLPFDTYQLDISGATVEAGEPTSHCAVNGSFQTVWYKFTPQADMTVRADIRGYSNPVVMTLYEGTALPDLLQLSPCKVAYDFWKNYFGFQVTGGKTYYIQVDSFYPYVQGSGRSLALSMIPAPPPDVDFVANPNQPFSGENATFYNTYLYDSAGFRFLPIVTWDFGDGTSVQASLSTSVAHSYAKEGSYTATLTVTTVDGRSGSRTRIITVENHDVAITKLTAPQSARAGQARTISAGVVSKFKDEQVRVTVYRSAPDPYSPWAYVADQTQIVPRGTNTKPTMFDFSYLFTAADAQVGKVSFQVVAEIDGGKRDLAPNNNTAISLPTKVSGALAAAASDDAAPVEDGMLYLPVITSHE
ncbi:MAG: PKD domain-containing protein [Caldilineaceae bacterium]